MTDSSANVTRLLHAAASGDRRDVDALMAAVYDDLRRLAVAQMQAERDDHTLQPTALIHEAYLKLIDQRNTDWTDRVHFFAIAARIIRRILVDHARQRHAVKRGAAYQRVTIEDSDLSHRENDVDLLTLDEALNDLSEIDQRQSAIVEMRFFGGLTLEEIAKALSIGKRSVDREWRAAKAWLWLRLGDDQPELSDG